MFEYDERVCENMNCKYWSEYRINRYRQYQRFMISLVRITFDQTFYSTLYLATGIKPAKLFLFAGGSN